jgi:hypothetical protein
MIKSYLQQLGPGASVVHGGNLLQRLAPIVLAVPLGVLWLILGLKRARKQLREDTKSRSLLDYAFLWPLLLGNASEAEKSVRRERLLTSRELLGVFLLVLLMVSAWVFEW